MLRKKRKSKRHFLKFCAAAHLAMFGAPAITWAQAPVIRASSLQATKPVTSAPQPLRDPSPHEPAPVVKKETLINQPPAARPAVPASPTPATQPPATLAPAPAAPNTQTQPAPGTTQAPAANNAPANPQANNNQNNTPRSRSASRNQQLGATRANFSSSPTMMGDFFGGGVSRIAGIDRREFGFVARGFILQGLPGDSNAVLGFDAGGGLPDDIFTTGVGTDTVNAPDGADSFAISEPLPPNDAPVSPGPGFLFDGGTAVYTNSANSAVQTPQAGTFADGDFWYIAYSYSNPLNGAAAPNGVVIAGPDAASRRVKISENFSPEVRNRFYTNYSFFNDVFGGLGDVSRWILGVEHVVVPGTMSIEARLPLAATYASSQQITGTEDRSFELGNPTLIGKAVLLRYDDLIWSGGLGVGAPLADDGKLMRNNEELLVIKNESVHLLPFTGLLLRATDDLFVQSYVQLDVDANGNPVYGNLAGGNLPLLGRFTDSTLMHLDVAVNRFVYRNARSSTLQAAILNAELHYTTTLQSSDRVDGNGIVVTNLSDRFDVLNATFGSHFMLGNSLVVSPAMAIPLRDGDDEQFDYEAMVQVNYLW